MESKRLFLIVNPISGTKSKTEILPKIEEKLREHGFAVTTKFTTAKGDATQYALSAVAEGFDAIAACGGDGTVNETARALCGTGVPLAIIPSGSGNGLARHIGLAPDELASIDVIHQANIRDCDYGIANGDKFFCAFGLGFDAQVAKKFAEQDTRGLNTYVKNAFQEFVKYQPRDYSITVDGSTTFDCKAYLVACCNASQYGNNAFIAPDASITDGVFDLIILRDAPHIQTLLAGLDMLTGMLPHNRQVEVIRAKTVDIHTFEHAPAHLDGEPIIAPTDIHIEIVPGKLRLYAAPQKKKFTPFITPLSYMTRDFSIALSRLFE